MHIKEISVNVARTFNLGNYESLRLEAGASASVDDGEDIGAARAALLEEARASLRQSYVEHHPAAKKGA